MCTVTVWHYECVDEEEDCASGYYRANGQWMLFLEYAPECSQYISKQWDAETCVSAPSTSVACDTYWCYESIGCNC